MTEDALMQAARRSLLKGAPRPATEEELLDAESQLGFALPPLLRRLYAEVSNGEWGPAYGANGIVTGARPDSPETDVIQWYADQRSATADEDDPTWPGWPKKLLAIIHWGCAIWSCVDCSGPEAPVVRWDPNGYGGPECASWEGAWLVEQPSLHAFLECWLADRLPFEMQSYEPWQRN